MDEIKAESILEGLLFSMGDAVSVGRLAEALGEDKKTTRQYLAHMQEKYEQEDRGIHLVWFEDS
nr:SMC-Scp complex subunit ScpB [Lachnospiraceae bacterium]